MTAGLGAAALACLPAQARLRGEVVEFGEVIAEKDHVAPATEQGVSLSQTRQLDDMRYVGHADRIEAQLCRRFGVTIRLAADPGEPMPRSIEARISHPRMTRPDGADGAQDSFPMPVTGSMAYAGWTFDHAWELQPGAWTIAFAFNGEVLASKDFTITAPTASGSLCPGAPVS